MNIKDGGIFVQIGTCDGLDEFCQLVKEHSASKIILIEPNSAMNNDIYKNYEGVNNVSLENVAITAMPEESVTLVYPQNINDGNAENGLSYRPCHFSLLPMTEWGRHLEKLTVQGITFNDLCAKHNLSHIDYLQIDTEGYDAQIIQSIDFSKIDIDIIKYEKWEFPEDAYSEYGELKKEYGINGMLIVGELLKSLGYELYEDPWDITAIKKHENGNNL